MRQQFAKAGLILAIATGLMLGLWQLAYPDHSDPKNL